MTLGPGWLFLLGTVLGGGGGVLVGRWATFLLLRNPLGWLVREYRELWRDVLHLCATGRLRAGR